MNNEFSSAKRNVESVGCRGDEQQGLIKVGCLKALSAALNLFGGMPSELQTALQKRALERQLVRQGYSRRLAIIAASQAFKRPQNSHVKETP